MDIIHQVILIFSKALKAILVSKVKVLKRYDIIDFIPLLTSLATMKQMN